MQPAPAVLRRAVAHLRRADPVLGAAMDTVGPCRLTVDCETPAFASLLESICYQQLAGKAAATIHGRLRALWPGGHPRPQDVAAATDDTLRGVGLSRQKISYVRDLATRAADGLPLDTLHTLPDEDVIEALTAVRGIGRWTVEMYLMFRLGRLDVLPVNDYGIQKAMQTLYRMRKMPKPDRMRKVAEPWRPYRTVACWYLWRTLDNPAGRA
jgi:DNA-3-methyladenine glycosylase II